ncbi:uncharacterized, partial [Tachysurus ichikawai]
RETFGTLCIEVNGTLTRPKDSDCTHTTGIPGMHRAAITR